MKEPVAYLIECEYLASTSYCRGRDPYEIQTFERSREVSFNPDRRPQSSIVRDVKVTQLNALPGVDALAQIIRKVDGGHSLGAGALAEAILEELRQ